MAHEVKTACDGSDALDLLVREVGRFDLLLTDIRMPIMDGIALALSASARFSRSDDFVDDRLRRAARARARARCDHS
jgi:CheY-like chemotaxis protein